MSGRRPRSPARDRTIRQVQQAGRRQWKKDSGYHQQARMENAFFRYKLIIGESLRARSRAGQETEAILACNILNQMTQLGRAGVATLSVVNGSVGSGALRVSFRTAQQRPSATTPSPIGSGPPPSTPSASISYSPPIPPHARLQWHTYDHWAETPGAHPTISRHISVYACTNGNAAIVELLLNAGANANTTWTEGETALMTAARTGSTDVVELLLDHGADVTAAETWRGQTALMWAAAEGHAEVIAPMLTHGADVTLRSAQGWSPLLFEAREGRIDVTRFLLAAGADVESALPVVKQETTTNAASGRWRRCWWIITLSNSSTIVASSTCTAQCSGVVPSGSAAETSAPRVRAARTSSASAARIAAMRSASTAPASAVAPTAKKTVKPKRTRRPRIDYSPGTLRR